MGERSLKQTEELLERFVKVMKDRMMQQSAKHSGNDVIDDYKCTCGHNVFRHDSAGKHPCYAQGCICMNFEEAGF